jgi:hypothetical protein
LIRLADVVLAVSAAVFCSNLEELLCALHAIKIKELVKVTVVSILSRNIFIMISTFMQVSIIVILSNLFKITIFYC